MRPDPFTWKPTPAYARFTREAQRRVMRQRWSDRAASARAAIERHAVLAVMAGLVVAYAIAVPVVARATIAGDVEPRLSQAQADSAAYRELALRLARGPEGGRMIVRLDADGPDDMIVQLETFARALRAYRGEVRP